MVHLAGSFGLDLYECPGTAITKFLRVGGPHNRDLLSHSLEAASLIKLLAELAPSEGWEEGISSMSSFSLAYR